MFPERISRCALDRPNAAIQTSTAADLNAVIARMAALRGDLAHLSQSVQSWAHAMGLALSKEISDGMNEATSHLMHFSSCARASLRWNTANPSASAPCA